MKKFVAKGYWQLGGLVLTPKGKTLGEGAPPIPFSSWEEAEDAVLRHPDFGNLVFLLPEEKPCKNKDQCAKPLQPQNGIGEFCCQWCGAEFDDQEELTLHLTACPVLVKLKEQARMEVFAELGLVGREDDHPVETGIQEIKPVAGAVEGDPAELADVAAQATARKELAEKEAQEKAERKAAHEAYVQRIEKRTQKKAKGKQAK